MHAIATAHLAHSPIGLLPLLVVHRPTKGILVVLEQFVSHYRHSYRFYFLFFILSKNNFRIRNPLLLVPSPPPPWSCPFYSRPCLPLSLLLSSILSSSRFLHPSFIRCILKLLGNLHCRSIFDPRDVVFISLLTAFTSRLGCREITLLPMIPILLEKSWMSSWLISWLLNFLYMSFLSPFTSLSQNAILWSFRNLPVALILVFTGLSDVLIWLDTPKSS